MKEKTKVYIYTRVSTAVQVDGYSLDAQKSRMKAYVFMVSQSASRMISAVPFSKSNDISPHSPSQST